MPHPVPPPEPPVIIANLPTQAFAAPLCRDVNCKVSTKLSRTSVSNRTLSKVALASPTQPETFAPEASPLKVAKSASLLGPAISVGHQILPAGTSVANQTSQMAPEVKYSVASGTNLLKELTPAATVESNGLPNQSQGKIARGASQALIANQRSPAKTEVRREISGLWEAKPVSSEGGASKRQSPPVTRLLTQERGGDVRQFEINTPPASDNPQVTPQQPQGTPGGGQNTPTFEIQPGGATQGDRSTTPTFEIQPGGATQGGQTTPQPQTAPLPQQNPPAPTAPPPAQDRQQPSTKPSTDGKTPPAKPSNSISLEGAIELTADRQEYDEERQVITAEGNVVMRFQNAILDADRLEVNLPNRIMVATGNVSLRRGEQVLRGDRFDYFFVQDSGTILNASGEIYQPRTGADFSATLPNDVGAAGLPQRPLSDRIIQNQPLQQITNPGGYTFAVGSGRQAENLARPETGGQINRVRFKAEKVDFDSESWRATNIRLTNDPFSPPELEVRADTARFRNLEPQVDEITTTGSRIVFDQGFSLPIFQDRILLDRREREPAIVNFGFDGTDRGGLFVERSFDIINTPKVRFRVTPQYFVQRAVGLGLFVNPAPDQPGVGKFIDPSDFGLKTRLDVTLSPRTEITGRTEFLTLNPSLFENNTRASLRLRQIVGTKLPHTLNLEYSYRDRLFNGSLGFQTVQSNLGAVLTSPLIPLGKSGVTLSYQLGAAYINADTDRIDLLEAVRTNNRVNLSRYQASATLSRYFTLWQGKALPATPTEGMRYTPAPVVPSLVVGTSLTGVGTAYSSGDSQNSLSGTVALYGQIGHFSRPFLDYTGFNLSYSQSVRSGLSPFLFDRISDTRVLSAGLTQQIWGPFRAGFQTSINLDTGQDISTDYFLEYSRRTYNVLLRYNPVLQLGSLSFRVNDFNWRGTPEPFEGSGVRPVVQGVTR
jgi:lipopolysaccharide export system protein LptA